MAPIIAGIQPEISKPLRRPAEIRKIMAFTMNVKKPNVRMLIGNVRKLRIGSNHMLKNPTTTAAIIAEPKDLIVNPGTNTAVKYKSRDEKTQVNNNCVISIFIFHFFVKITGFVV